MTLRVVARNALSLIAANVISGVVGFAVTVLLVRYLGVERLGTYTYLTTYAALFGIVSSFGLHLVITRQVAAEPRETNARLGSVLLVQALLSPLALMLTIGSAFLFHPASEVLLIALCGIGVILASVAGSYGAVVTGKEKIHLNASVSVGMAVLWGLFVLGLIALRLDVLGLIVLFVIHKLANVAALRLVCRKACGVTPHFGLQNPPLRGLLVSALPFALVIVLNDFYWNVSTILLGRLKGADEVGMFAAAFRVIGFLVTMVGTVSGVLYPRLAHLFSADPDSFALLIGRTRKYSLAVGLPLGLAMSLLAYRIIVVLFGPEFADAGRSLQLLGWFIPLCCVFSPLSSALLAMGAERTWLTLQSIATGVVIAGSLTLIPVLGHFGAAGALLGSGVFLAAAVPLAIRAKGMPVALTPADLKVWGALGSMALILWVLRSTPLPALLASSAAYVAVLYLAGFVTVEERLSLRSALAMRRDT